MQKRFIVVPAGGSFEDMVRLKGDKEIGDKVNKIIGRLAQENDLKGVIDVADFNDEDKLGKGKDMIDRLSKLVGIFDGLNLGGNRAEGDDLLGDAYEYLMRHFATESGKSKGQFYTPSEVSRILSKVIGIGNDTSQDMTVYDPTCGSGSLLLKAAGEAPKSLTIYGQENDNATAALARMNMILHNNATAEIWKDNTLSTPHWKNPDGSLKTFDFAVANPPFSYKSWSNGVNLAEDEFGRFEYGTPPDKNGDYAFLLHILKSLKTRGKAAVILPHGVLFRGNAEAGIRRKLIRQGYIKGIIGLPANLFYGTGIPACIIVIDKAHATACTGIFMVDGSKGFLKDGNKNRLRDQDIHKIVDAFNRKMELPRFSRMVKFSEIEKNEFNLNIPRYIDSSQPEDLHDLAAHLNGGIPDADLDALGHFWQVFPNLRADLFAPGTRKGYSNALVKAGEVKQTILDHPEFKAFAEKTLGRYSAWRAAHDDCLNGLEKGSHPGHLIHDISEDLLARFCNADLLDKYDIYQILMEYWAETMQDDIYVISQDGWKAGNVLRLLVAKKGEKLRETPDLVIGKKKYKSDLIPPDLIVARYFVAEKQVIDDLQAQKDAISLELEQLMEEHSNDEGLLEEAKNDKGKVTKATLKARIKEIEKDAGAMDELTLLKQCQALMDKEAGASRNIKAAQDDLDDKVFKKYPKLDKAEIKILVVDDKWQARLESAIQAEIERVTQTLATRIRELEERYAEPLSKLTEEVATLSAQVDDHLRRMGLVW